MSAETIGCPEGYSVVLVRQPGNMTNQGVTPEPVGTLSEIISLSWGRTLTSGASESTVTSTKCYANCGLVTQNSNWTGIDPWAHELWLYRDGALCWQGPIVNIRETRDSFIFTARDVLEWVYHREIVSFYAQTYTATGIASSLINTFFVNDDPDIISHKVTFPYATGEMSVKYDRAQFTVGQKFDELTQAGLEYSTLGRAIYLMGPRPANDDAPFLINLADIIGDAEIVKDGLDYGDHIVGLGEGITFGIDPSANHRQYYGKVTYPPTRFPNVTNISQLQAISKIFYEAKSNLSPQLVIPSGSTLSPSTTVYAENYAMKEENLRLAFSHFICGFQYNVQVSEPFCQPAQYPMRLSELAVSWDDEGEKVAVSFDSLPGPVT